MSYNNGQEPLDEYKWATKMAQELFSKERSFFELDDMMGECADGCYVEPDGTCPHGFHSLALVLGLI